MTGVLTALTLLLSACVAVESLPLYFSRVPYNGPYLEMWGDMFVAKLNIGNPPVTYNLTLDDSEYHSVLVGAGATPQECEVSTRQYFDTSRSTTFRRGKQSGYTMPAYAEGRECMGLIPQNTMNTSTLTFGRDDVSLDKIGTFKAQQLHVVTTFNDSWNKYWASDGILGLSSHLQDGPISLAESLASTIGRQCTGKPKKAGLCNTASLYLPGNRVLSPFGDSTPNNGNGKPVGGIEFGPVSSACGTIQEADPVSGSYDWSFFVGKVTLGSLTTTRYAAKGTLGLSDPKLLTMPLELMQPFMAQIGAFYNDTAGPRSDPYYTYYVDCSTIPSLPTITVQLRGGVTLQFSAKEYVESIPGEKYCPVLLRDSWIGLWGFGNRLAHSNCVVYNFRNGKLGFGPIVNKSA